MNEDNGVSLRAGLLPSVEPEEVSPLRAAIPDALGQAIILACKAHEGQVDKGGAPYILHPLRVMLAVGGEGQRIAAVLHDTVEDTGLELGLIRNRFGADVADAVDALSRRDGEDYMQFIERCAANDIGRVVKLADIADNMDLSRIPNPTMMDLRRLEKYAEARSKLAAIAIPARQGEDALAAEFTGSAGRRGGMR